MSDGSRSIGFRRAALQLGGLWALAFAQPLFELLGRNAQFFVARESTTGDIVVMAFGYALVPPVAAAAGVWALGRIRPSAGWAAHLTLIALLVAALLLPPLGDALGGSAAAIAVALALGAGASAMYARMAGVRSLLTVLSPAPLIVVLLLLAFSPVRELLFPGDASGAIRGPARSSTPIVLVVLDELPRSTLTDPAGTIDPELFPTFARLARTSIWYRNATTVDDLSGEAVPSQLTGELPREGSLPTADRHPRNLFTLFKRSHGLTVIEPITELCPPSLCPRSRRGALDRLDGLRADLKVVVQHLLAPEDLRDGLPAIDRVWEGFDDGPRVATLRGGRNLKGEVMARLAASDAPAEFRQAIGALDRPGSRPPLVFLHSTLPHATWRFLPDGREYPLHGRDFPGLGPKGWTGPQWLVDQGFQRHVLQVQYTDRLLGELLDRLRSTGVFDDAVIVVTADHGASFRAGRPRRPVSEDTASDIALVPFFVKLPGQRQGTVDDRAVRSIDVLPTIAGAAGVRLPWRPDGMPAGERRVDPTARIDVSHAGAPVLSAPLGSILRKLRAREVVEARLLRHGVYAFGPRPELIGRRVAGSRAAIDARATVDALNGYGAIDTRARSIPAYVSGEVDGLKADAVLAVAVNGRVEATTRVYGEGGRLGFTAVVPPSSLRDGRNAVAVLEVLRDGAMRTIRLRSA